MTRKLAAVKEEVESNLFHQCDALISGWLNEQPSNSLDNYWLQLEKAKWREHRYFQMMQTCLWGKGDD